jgi:polar amino acid transport system substrate-binding protein
MKTALLTLALLLFSNDVPALEMFVLVTEEAAPYNYHDDSTNTIVGSSTEIAQELFTRANLPHRVAIYPWARAYEMAQANQLNCVFSTTRTKEREPYFTWVGPLVTNHWILYALPNTNIRLKTLNDAKAYKIGGYRDDAIVLYLNSQGFNNIDIANNNEQALQKLSTGKVDLWATGAGGIVKAQHEGIKVTPLLNFKKTELYMACHPATPSNIIAQLNNILTAMCKDGTVSKINKKYNIGTLP